MVPGGANAGGFAASNLKGLGTTAEIALSSEEEEAWPPSVAMGPREGEVAAAAAAAAILWVSARRVRWDRRASLTAITNALPQCLCSLFMNCPTTKRAKYRLNLSALA